MSPLQKYPPSVGFVAQGTNMVRRSKFLSFQYSEIFEVLNLTKVSSEDYSCHQLQLLIEEDMAYYLYLWNPKEWRWPELGDAIQAVNKNANYIEPWSCNKSVRIKEKDKFVLLKVGAEPKGVIGCGFVVSNITKKLHWNEEKAKKGIELSYSDLLFQALSDTPIIPLEKLRGHFPSVNWTPRAGGNSLADQIGEWIFEVVSSNRDINFKEISDAELGEFVQAAGHDISNSKEIASVNRAFAEYDKIGHQEFLKLGGFKDPKKYWVKSKTGNLYPSKAIFGFVNGKKSGECHGTEARKWLTSKGFEIITNSQKEHDIFESDVANLLSNRSIQKLEELAKKNGNLVPEMSLSSVYQFKRNPHVAAYARKKANGICESCGSPAPFISKHDGLPFLEVHHKKPLSVGGSDTIDNTVAICPNCHRKAHYG